MWTLLAGALLSIHQAYGYSAGAGSSACDVSMLPGHGPDPQTSPSPYSITVNSNQYAANGVLTVTLNGTTPFKGFLVMARKEDGSPTAVGMFQSTGNTAVSLVQNRCSGGLTHTQAYSGNPSNRVELQWNAPSSSVGNIVFYATFVLNYNTFWTKVQSKGIWSGDGVKPAEASSTAPTIAVDGPQILPVTRDGCGTQKGCYDDCTFNACSFLLTWTSNDFFSVDFELSASDVNANGYVAVGFSRVNRMEDVTIIACMNDGISSSVRLFYAKSKVLGVEPVSGGAVSSSSASYKNSERKISCRFRYDNALANGGTLKDLSDQHYIFIARGMVSGDTLSKHTNLPIISQRTTRFLSPPLVSRTSNRHALPVLVITTLIIVLFR